MKFEEALQLLKEGMKVRRRGWDEKTMRAYLTDNQLCMEDKNNKCPIAVMYIGDILTDDWEEYREPLLTNEEKGYLQMNIEFHPEEITSVNVRFHDHFNIVYLQYEPNGFDYCMVNKNYFKNLEEKKDYTLDELGLI